MLGGGLIGLPFGCSSSSKGRRDALDAGLDLYSPEDLRRIDQLTAEDIERLPEASPEEVREFLDNVEAQAELHQDQLVDDAGNSKVPPGQYVVDSQPVMAWNENPRDIADWRFTVTGEVENALEFTWEEWLQLPRFDLVADFHCVTAWTMLDIPWGGVRPKTLFEMAGLKPSAKFVISDCEHGYTTNMDLAEMLKENVLFPDTRFGEPLPHKYGGPLRGLIPDRYGYKSGKWVTGIRILAHDEPGYWETKGYSNTADVWTEDRYA